MDDDKKKTDSKGPPAVAADTHLPDGTSPDQEELLEVIRQIDEMGDLDPRARDQLMADLRKTKPSLWPAMVQQFRSALAFRRQLEAREASSTGSMSVSRDEAIGQAFAAIDTSDAGRVTRSRTATRERSSRRDLPGERDPFPPTPDLVDPQARGGQAGLRSTDPVPSEGQVSRRSSESWPENPRVAFPEIARVDQRTGGNAGHPAPIELPDRAANATTKTEQAAGEKTHPVRMATATAEQRQQPNTVATEASPIPVTISERGELASMITDLEQQTASPPSSSEEVSRHAALRMLYLAAGRRDDALRPIPGISPAQQDFWLQQLYGLATYLDSQQQPSATLRAAAAKRHLSEAERKLGELGTLTVENLAFCTEVSSFGVYKEFETREFTPGQAVLLYAEVENFKSEQTEEGFHTALRSSYQILDRDGKQVGDHEYSVTEDFCKNHRRDFFMRYFLRLPEGIHGGAYTLELTIEDTLANKIGQSSISFEIKEQKGK